MWDVLWDDFENRAAALTAGHPLDHQFNFDAEWEALDGDHMDEGGAINWTIRWQLEGRDPFVPTPIPPQQLQLPELYSGQPWIYCRPWIAFVTINPSIGPREIYPTRQHRSCHDNEELVNFFETRFEPAPAQHFLHHGRHNAFPVSWEINRKKVLVAKYQPTWGNIDYALTRCIPPRYPEYDFALPQPLGRAAAIFDVVPWKFRKWREVQAMPALRTALIEAGSQRLMNTLQAYKPIQDRPPSVIISAGEYSRRAMRIVDHNANGRGIPDFDGKSPGYYQTGHIRLNDRLVPWFGVPAPTTEYFFIAMGKISANIRDVIGVALG